MTPLYNLVNKLRNTFIYKPVAIIAPLVFIIIAAVATRYVQLSYTHTENEALQKESRFASFELAENLRRNVIHKVRILQILAQGHSDFFPNQKKEFYKIAAAIVKNSPGFYGVAWLDPEGVVRWVYPEEPNRAAIGKIISQRDEEKDYLVLAKETRKPTISHILDLYQGPKGIIMYVPVFEGDKFKGWVDGVIDLTSSFDHFFERRKLEGLNATIKWKGHEDTAYTYGNAIDQNAEIKFESQVLNQTVIVEMDLQRGNNQLGTRGDRLNRAFIIIYAAIILIGIFLYYLIKSQNKVVMLYRALKRDKTLISILSHDMATPLTIISENIRRLKEKLGGQNYPEVDRIVRSSDRQTDLLTRVRSFHATNIKKKRLELYPARATDLIEETIALYEEQFKAKNITYEIESPDEVIYCLTDRMTAAHNVLGNVISNAIKFSNSDSDIVIRTYKDKNYVVIEVEDKGHGIPKEILDHLFNEEEITSTTGTKGERGTGLGMLQIKAFMEFYKGDIKIHTSEKGTRVQLFFRSTEI